MAENRLEAILDIGLSVTKGQAEKIRKQIRGTVESAIPKSFPGLDLDNIFRFKQKSQGLRQLRSEIQRISDLQKGVGKQDPERSRQLQSQLDLLNQISQVLRTQQDVSGGELKQGEKLASQLKERKKDYRDLTQEQKKYLEQYRQTIAQRSSQIRSVVSGGSRLSQGGSPIIMTETAQLQKNLAEEVRALDNLTDVQKLEAEDRRRTREALKRQRNEEERANREVREAKKEQAETLRQNTADAKRQRRLEQSRASRQRAGLGIDALNAAGGTGSINSLRGDDLPFVVEGLQRKLKAYNRLQENLLRNGRENSAQFAENKQKIDDYSDALKHAQQRMRGFSSVVRESALFLRQFIRLGIGFSAVFTVIDGVRALGRSLVELDEQLKSIQAIAQATDAEMRTIGSSIQSVATQTIYSVTEIAKATQTLAQAGVSIQEIPKALKATATFAAGTASDIQVSADLLTTMRDVFDNLDFKGVSDQLTSVINVSKTSADDLKTIVSTSASSAEQFEVGSQNYLAGVATLRNAGLKASTVGTGLRRVMIDLFTPDDSIIKQLKARYEDLGEELTESQIRGRFFAFQNSRSPLVAGLKELQRLGYAQGEGKQELQTAFDIRSRNAISALIRNIPELERLAPQIQIGNAALNASQTQMESLANSARNLGAAISVLANSVAGDAVPALAQMTRDLTEVIQKTTELNEGLKSTTGTGIGPALLSGGLSAGLSYLTTRGGLGRRFANAAGGAVAGTTAGLYAPQSQLGNFANSLLSIFAGPAFVSALGAAITGGLRASGTSAATRGKVGRGGRNNTGRPVRTNRADIGTNAANAALTISAFGGKLTRFFGRIGGFFTRLLAPLNDIFRIIGNVMSKTPALAKVASLVGRWANPVVGFVLTLLSVGSILRSIGTEADGADLMKRAEAAQNNFNRQIEEYNSKLEQIAQFDLTVDQAPQNTAAAALQELQSQQRDLENSQNNFLNGQIQNLGQVRSIFEQLASGQGSIIGSGFRKELLKQLSGQIRLTDGAGNPIDVTTEQLEKLPNAVQQMADSVAGVRNQTDGLQTALAQMVSQIKDKPVSQLNDTERALKDIVDGLSQYEYQLVAGIREATDTNRFGDLLADIFNEIRERAESQITQPELDKQKDQLIQDILTGKLSRQDIQDRVNELQRSAGELGQSVEDFLDSFTSQLDQAAQELANQRENTSRNVGYFSGISSSQNLLRPNEERTQQSLEDTQNAVENNRTRFDNERRQAMEEVRNRALPTIETIKSMAEDPEFQDWRNENRNNIKTDQLRAFEAIAAGDYDVSDLTQIGKGGIPELNAKFNRAASLMDQFTETGQQAEEAAAQVQSVYLQRVDLQRQEMEADQRLSALKMSRAPLQEQLKALETRQQAKAAQINDQLEFELAQRSTVGDDVNAAARSQNKIAGLQNQLAELTNRQVQEKLDLLKSNYDQRQQSNQSDVEAAAAGGDIQAFNEANARQRQALEDYISQRRPYLEQAGVSEEGIRRISDSMRSDFSPSGRDVGSAQRVAENSLSDEDRALLNSNGYTTGNAGVDAYRDQQGTQPGREELIESERRRLDLLKQRLQFLREQRDLNRGNTEEINKYDDAIASVNERIGETRGELSDLNSSFSDQLRKGFNFEQLRNTLQNANSDVSGLGTNIRESLTGGVDSFADSLTEAQVQANSFKDSVGNAFQSLAQSILQSLNRAFANQVARQLLGFAASAFGGGMTQSTQTSFSDAGINVGGTKSWAGYADGGIIRGPGTGTSDSVPMWGSNGEGVVTAKAVDHYGEDLIHKLNKRALPKFRDGGIVGGTMKNRSVGNGGASNQGPQTVVNVENHTDSKAETRKRKGNNGEDITDVLIGAAADDVRSGGKLGQAVLSTVNSGRSLEG